MQPLRASVIIAAWNACAVLGRCLDSLERQEFRGGFETIVVDDGSTDGTVGVLRAHADRVRVISKAENAGFSACNNEAAQVARGRILLFLNADTELLTPDALERVVAAAEAPGVGIAGPRLLNPDGALQPSCAGYPKVVLALLLATGLWRALPDRVRARVAPQFWSHDRARDTDWLLGAAIAVPAEAFRDLKGFWPTTYSEEQDLAYRARRLGLRVRFEPAARVMHVGNHSLAQRWSDAERAERVARAERAFLEAHYGPRYAASLRLILRCGYSARAVAHGALRRRDRAEVFRRMARVHAGRRAPPRRR